MGDKIRIGVIGIGDISKIYLNNLQNYLELVEVTACASRSLEKAQKNAAEHKIAKPYASVDELLADPDVDMVLNLTTPDAHYQINMAALAAGKHVYTEKPLAATFAEGLEIMALAREKGLCVGCAPDTFLGSRLQNCRKLIDEGSLGDLIGASAFFVSHGPEWEHLDPTFVLQPGAGPLLDMGPYYVTALLSLLGPVKSICAMSSRAFNTRVIELGALKGQSVPVNTDTHITASLEFTNGAMVTMITSFDVWDSELPRMELYGTKGTLCLKDEDPLDGPDVFGGDLLLRTRDEYRWVSFPRDQECLKREWITVQVEHAFDTVSHQKNPRGIGLVDMVYALNQNRPPRASGEMALHALEVMEGIMVSAKEKRFVEPQTSFDIPAPLVPARNDEDVVF